MSAGRLVAVVAAILVAVAGVRIAVPGPFLRHAVCAAAPQAVLDNPAATGSYGQLQAALVQLRHHDPQDPMALMGEAAVYAVDHFDERQREKVAAAIVVECASGGWLTGRPRLH